MKIAIIVREETMAKCTGKGCLNAFFEKIDSFEGYPNDAQLIGFTNDAGDIDKKIDSLISEGVDTVHISTCIRGKNENYEEMVRRFAQFFDVVGYTHGSFEGRTRPAICMKKQGEND